MRNTDVRPFPASALGAAACCLVAVACAVAQQAAPKNPAATNPAASQSSAGQTSAGQNGVNQNAAAAPSANKLSVLAVVNSQEITRQQLAQDCLARHGKDVLESLVNKQLIITACAQRGIQITPAEIEAEVQKRAAKFGLSVERWLTLLEKERQISPQQYRRDIVWPSLALYRLAANDIQVTSEELRLAMDSELGPRARARLIATTSKPKAEQILAKARANPELFAQLAKEHSEDAHSASVGGLIPDIRSRGGDPGVEKAVFALKEGEISNIVPAGNQYLIFKCERKFLPSVLGAADRKQWEERLLDQLREQKLRKASETLFRKLQDEAQVANVYNSAELRQKMPGVAATINGETITLLSLAEECITRHGAEVLDGEIHRLLLTQELARRKLAVTQADIDAEVARAAESYGYLANGKPDVQAWLKYVTSDDGATVDLYVRDAVWPSVALKKLVSNKVEVTEDDLRKGFEANFGERVEAQVIVLSDQRLAHKAWTLARENNSEQYFAGLAREYSVEPMSRANSGRVPPIQRHGGRPHLEDEAFKLKPGELSGIVAVGDKFVIVRCLGRTTPVVQDFNVVREELRRDLHEKKLRVAMNQEFDRVREQAQIDNFLVGHSQSGKRGDAKQVSHQEAVGGRVPFAKRPTQGPALPPK